MLAVIIQYSQRQIILWTFTTYPQCANPSWNGPHAVRVEVAQFKPTAEWGRGPYEAQTSQNPYNANSDPVNCKNGIQKSVQ